MPFLQKISWQTTCSCAHYPFVCNAETVCRISLPPPSVQKARRITIVCSWMRIMRANASVWRHIKHPSLLPLSCLLTAHCHPLYILQRLQPHVWCLWVLILFCLCPLRCLSRVCCLHCCGRRGLALMLAPAAVLMVSCLRRGCTRPPALWGVRQRRTPAGQHAVHVGSQAVCTAMCTQKSGQQLLFEKFSEVSKQRRTSTTCRTAAQRNMACTSDTANAQALLSRTHSHC